MTPPIRAAPISGPTSKALIDRVKGDAAKLHAGESRTRRCRSIWSPPRPAASIPTSRRRRACSRCRASPRRAACPRTRCASWWTTISKAACSGMIGEPHVNVLKLNLALDAHARPAAAGKSVISARMADDDDRTATNRPSPDALLQQAGEEGRGRLKIFLGAAPGVGKTYEMLTQARQRRLEGVDVGHRRRRDPWPRRDRRCSPRASRSFRKKRIAYKGHVLAEMDLDAILQRRPKLVLVDELAHTNAPGSRHPKRYWMSRNCSPPASTSTPRSTSSISKASTTSSPRSPASACARPCPIPSSTAPTRSRWST